MVHILMATYNGEKFLSQQIDSILNQSYNDWKLFISDDCSTDGTLEVVNRYITEYPDKIILLSTGQRFGGAKENFIYLFNHCPDADYYMFTDQDDVWLENKITLFVDKYKEVQQRKNIGILIYSDLKVVDTELNVISESFINYACLKLPRKYLNSKVLVANYIPGCVMFFDDELRKQIGLLPQECGLHDWWLTLYASFFGEIYFIDKSLNLYRQHELNQVGAGDNSFINSLTNILVSIFTGKIKNKIIETCDLFVNNKKYLQSKKFLELYGYKMSDKDIKLIQNQIYLFYGKNRCKKIFYFLKNHYFKNTFLATVYYGVAILRGAKN